MANKLKIKYLYLITFFQLFISANDGAISKRLFKLSNKVDNESVSTVCNVLQIRKSTNLKQKKF